jgi:FlaA1/EpsC-like NDP-sugar epimerase
LKILITGGSGTLGSNLLKHWYRKHQLTVISKDWHRQERLSAQYPHVRFHQCDITNTQAVLEACRGQDVLIHAAAIKGIAHSEKQPIEAARVNVEGAAIVARCWAATGQNRPALLISSDKAVSPLNSYGADKKRGESIFRKYGWSALRYGNVVVSQGAFLEKWAALREQDKPVPIRVSAQTSEAPTRFIVELDHAVKMVEAAIGAPRPGIFVPVGLSAFRIDDVAKALDYPVVYEHLLPGEKMHEELVARGEGVEYTATILARISDDPYWPASDDYRAPFISRTAPRLTGQQMVELLEGNI